MKLSTGCRLLLGGAVLSAASPAGAFVRATTGFAGDTPLAWSSGCVVIAVTAPPAGQVGWDDVLGATRAAGETWTQGAAICGGGFRFMVERAGSPLDVANDGVNAVILRTHDYCGDRGCDPLSMAITWTYEVDRSGTPEDGRIYEADIEINAEAYEWGLGADAAGGINDLQSALTHELGHVLGLDHPCYEPGLGLPRPLDDQGNPAPNCAGASQAVSDSVLTPASSYLAERRTLSDDDVRGICAIYPDGTGAHCQGQLAPEGCCSVAGSGTPTASFVWLFVGVVWVIRRSPRRLIRRTSAERLTRRRFDRGLLWLVCWLDAGCGGHGGPALEVCHDVAGPGEACIAGGTFVMGHNPIPDPRAPLAQIPQLHAPAHRVKLRPFFMDLRPVTNGEYVSCLDAAACPDECQAADTENSVGSTGCGSGSTFYLRYHVCDPALANHPVATVFDLGAAAYCAWVGRRLPTEAEWERAARGPQGTDYPWGNAAPDCSRYGCDLAPLGDSSTPFVPVGAYPVDRTTGDVSPEGLRFMVTGVPEFLDDWYYDYPFDNGQPIPDPRGEPFLGSIGQTARGNINARLPLYKGQSSLPPDQAHEPFPQPAWARAGNTWLGRGGFRCARDDR